jgi:tetratricopeptide (TPR) repeat protein
MPEPEIIEQLLALLEEGTQSLLKEASKTNSQQLLYYETFVKALGRSGQKNAGFKLLSCLELLSFHFQKQKEIQPHETAYLAGIVEALTSLKFVEAALPLNKIRWAFGENSLFWKQTLDFHQELLQHAPPTPENTAVKTAIFYNEQGALKQIKGDYSGALQDFNEAIQRNPQFFEAYLFRAYLKADLNDTQGALQDFTQALALNPQHAQTYFERGSLRAKVVSKASASSDFQIFLQLTQHQNSAEILRVRQWIYQNFPELQKK